MTDLLRNTIDGLTVGSSYALLALGFSLIFGVIGRLNLSYGPSIMIGAYAGTLLHLQLGAGAIEVAAATVLGAVLVGAYVERLCFAPMQAGAAIASMVSSFAIWMQLEELAVLVLPRHTYAFPPLPFAGPVQIGAVTLRIEHLVMFASAAALALALHALLRRSRFGLALRAVAESPEAAGLMGVDVRRTMFLAFLLASAVGGVAGYLIAATDQQITPMFGMWTTFKGLIAMMLGGLGSMPGAVLGGLLLGLIEMHTQWYLGPQWRDLIAFFLLFVVLVWRPGGLLGQARVREATAAGRRA
jgi:branched-subunit amino acid ABC-type transport system permease component